MSGWKCLENQVMRGGKMVLGLGDDSCVRVLFLCMISLYIVRVVDVVSVLTFYVYPLGNSLLSSFWPDSYVIGIVR